MPMEIGGQPGEFLVLEYQDGDRIYVPVQQLHLVSRYTGAAPENAPLHKLGTDQWARARKRAADQIRDVAAELLDLYARRKAQQGLSLPANEHDYQAFASAFPFEETADQAEAIRQVLADLASERPMDRIVCGDVGFGKTEVAMRAAFVAAQAGKQVAVLAPDHAARAAAPGELPRPLRRLAGARGGACRASAAPRKPQAVLEGLEQGKVDIVIATHRLLHAHARFKDLGLLIIDEEHRFGVRDKQRLQALRANVHVLTLTATPIPRTLNMALGGLRDLSLITTAAGGAPGDQDLPHRVARADAARGGAARAAPRRADLLRAQRGAHHRQDRRRAAGAGTGGERARRPRADARARPRAADGGFLPPPLQRAGVHDDHRERHRRAHGQHHHDQPRRSHGTRAAAPAARPRRALAPPRLRLSHRPAAPGAGARCGQAPGGDRVDGGARRRLRAGDARS